MSGLETPKERLIRERERDEFIAGIGLREDYRRTFDTEHGRRVLADFVLGGHMLETTCSGNAWSYFYEGERNWVHRIAGKIPDLVGQVIGEILAKQQEEMDTTIIEITRGNQ